MDQKIIKCFKNIDFVKRYRKLAEGNVYDNKSFMNYENSKVLDLITNLGYEVKYNKRENFFKIIQEFGDFKFQFNIVLKRGIVELIWDIHEQNKRIPIGGPWSMIVELVSPEEPRFKLPIFHDYNELEKILKDVFGIFEDMKSELSIKNCSG